MRESCTPLNWRESTTGYNDSIWAKLGLPEQLPAGDRDSIHIYTGGSCKKIPRSTLLAGWGFAVSDSGGIPNGDGRLLLDACGPV
eukprot:7745866-Pyramimonas_sp.AAC.1